MPVSADPGADPSRAFRFAPRAYPCCPSSSIRSNPFAASVISVGDQADGRKSDTGIPAGKMVEFEVMVRPIKAPAAQGEGEPDRPATERLEAGRCRARLIVALLMASPLARACAGGGLVARIGAPCRGLFRPILGGACCRSSVVEHSIGNGEVDSSILSGSTTVRAKTPGSVDRKRHDLIRGADAHFYVASGSLFDICAKPPRSRRFSAASRVSSEWKSGS
jgi:hypothetical protein